MMESPSRVISICVFFCVFLISHSLSCLDRDVSSDCLNDPACAWCAGSMFYENDYHDMEVCVTKDDYDAEYALLVPDDYDSYVNFDRRDCALAPTMVPTARPTTLDFVPGVPGDCLNHDQTF